MPLFAAFLLGMGEEERERRRISCVLSITY